MGLELHLASASTVAVISVRSNPLLIAVFETATLWLQASLISSKSLEGDGLNYDMQMSPKRFWYAEVSIERGSRKLMLSRVRTCKKIV